MRTFLPVTALLAIASGCAPSQAEVFRPVGRTAETRTGYAVAWQRDASVAPAVDGLLADGLSLDDATRIALASSRRLQAAFDELGVARGDLLAASVLRNPEVEAELRYPSGGGTPNLELAATQDVLDLITRSRRRGVALAELEAARLDATGAVVDLVAAVRAAYYAAQADEQRLELRTSIFDAVDASYTLAQRLHTAGNITDLDLLRERDLYEQARIDRDVAASMRLRSRDRLNATLGLWGEATAWSLEGRLPDVPEAEMELADIESRAVAQSLELEADRWRLRAAGGRVGVARLGRWLPELGVGVIAEREGADGHWSVGPTVGLSIPLWDHNTGAIARSEAALSAGQHTYAARAIEVRAAARSARERLRAARERALAYRDTVLPLRADLVDQTLRAYNAMAASAFELFEAKRRQIEAGAAYLDVLVEYWNARAAVDQLLAGRTPGSGDVSAAAPTTEPETRSRGH